MDTSPEPALPAQVSVEEKFLPEGSCITLCKLSSGPVETASLKALAQIFPGFSPDRVVMLYGEHSWLPRLAPPEEQAWIKAAGEYRQAQEIFKASGGLLLSLVTQCLVGGIYLVHGMAARYRLLYETAQVYPALSAELYERIFKTPYPHPVKAEAALTSGIVTHVTNPKSLDNILSALLHKPGSNSPLP